MSEASNDTRTFPMQDGPDITWGTAEKIYGLYQALGHKTQSLERIAERGGFGWHEVYYMWLRAKDKLGDARRQFK